MIIKYLFLFIVLSCSLTKNESEIISIPDNYYEKKDTISEKENICIIGDAGHGTPEQYLVGKALKEKKCTHVFYVGDVIYESGLTGKDDPQFIEKFYNPYKDLIKDKNFKAFHIALGNHDYKQNPKAWIELSKIHPYIIAPDTFFVENYKGSCFYILDSNFFMRRLDFKNQKIHKEWLRYQSKNGNDRCKIKLAFAHHPFISSGLHGDASEPLRTFYEQNVVGMFDMFFTGHDHILIDEGTYKGTRLIVSGAGSDVLPPRRMPYQKTFISSKIGFVVINLLKDKIHYEFITVEKTKMTTAFSSDHPLISSKK